MKFRRLVLIMAVGLVSSVSAAQGSAPPSSADTSRPLRVRVSQGVAKKLLTKKVPPEYPAEARHDHIEGDVVLKAIIGTDGLVTDLTLESGPPVLGQAAMDAVKKWKYKPYLLNGQPVEIETQVVVNFELSAH
jgi:protein TonB